MDELTSQLDLLSKEQKDSLMRTLVRQKVKNKEDLRRWILLFLDVDLSDCVVSRFSNSNPLDFAWDIYSFCLDDKNDNPLTLMAIAGRASQKTLSAAVLQIILPLHFGRSVVHFGGSMDQSRRAYYYAKKFMGREYVKDFLASDPTQQKTHFNIDGQDVTIEILPITGMSTQGSHAPVVSLDELASLPPDKIRAYQDISGVPSYTHDGKPWVRFGISSRKGAYTVIETEYEEREKNGTIFKFWTVLENTKRCPDELSGTEPYSYYVNVVDNAKCTISQYEKLIEIEKTKYELVHAFTKCYDCALACLCSGDAKKQTSTCRTLRPINSLIKEFKTSPLEWFLSQKMSMKPSTEGLVFPKFKKETFEKTPNEIYELITGDKNSTPMSESDLIVYMKYKGFVFNAGIDFGYTDPTAVVVTAEDPLGNIFVLSVQSEVGMEPDEIKNMILKTHEKYGFTRLYPDTASPTLIKMIKKLRKFAVIDNYSKSGQIEAGIVLIRQKISPIGRDTMFYGIKGNVDFLVTEMTKYHYAYNSSGKLDESPAGEFDHCFTENHEILTQNGWKKFEDLTYSDKVAAVTNEKTIIFETPTQIIKNKYSGNVYKFKGKSIDFTVTPEHRLIHISQYNLKKTKTFNFEEIKAKDFKYNELFIPVSATVDEKGRVSNQPFLEWGLTDYEWGWLLGMFISDGCTNINHGMFRTHWSQKKEPHLSKLRELFKKVSKITPICNWTDKRSKVVTFETKQTRYHDYFSQFGKANQKHIPRHVLKNSNKEILTGLLKGLMDGDGSIMGRNNEYTTVSKRLSDDFSELCTLLGYGTNVKKAFISKQKKRQPCYKIRIKNRKNYPTVHIPIKTHMSIEKYNGLIYCVSVSTGMIMCRNNGKNFISGNSIDSLRYIAINAWKSKSVLILPQDPLGVPSIEKQNEQTQKKYTNWLSDEIQKATKAQQDQSIDDGQGVKVSKSKGFIWDV